MRLRCGGCLRTLLGEDKQMVSQVYGTSGAVTLCDSCEAYEKKKIEELGTNDVPTLRLWYLGERRATERAEAAQEKE